MQQLQGGTLPSLGLALSSVARCKGDIPSGDICACVSAHNLPGCKSLKHALFVVL